MSLQEKLEASSVGTLEGYSQLCPDETKFLKEIASSKDIETILEIGFNAGHSSELFLSANPDATVVSFDIGVHSYVQTGKEYIDKTFPGRHTLILGNSLDTVPDYEAKNPEPFDLIFIDGGHDYKTAHGDLINCHLLAHEDTIVVMDDTMNTPSMQRDYNIGPTRAWAVCKKWNRIEEIGTSDFPSGHGVSWGRYVFTD